MTEPSACFSCFFPCSRNHSLAFSISFAAFVTQFSANLSSASRTFELRTASAASKPNARSACRFSFMDGEEVVSESFRFKVPAHSIKLAPARSSLVDPGIRFVKSTRACALARGGTQQSRP